MICRKTSIMACAFVMTAALALLLLANGAGAAPAEEWKKTFGDNWHAGESVQQTSDGGYVLTASYIIPNKIGNVGIIKTDTYGNKQWSKILGVGNSYEEVHAVRQTSDGGYIIVGSKQFVGLVPPEHGGYEAWLIKTDANGNEKWNRTFGGYEVDKAYSVQQTLDGGYILAGLTSVDMSTKVWLIKTDANGNEEWEKTFGKIDWWCGHYMDAYPFQPAQQTSDGGYIFAGCIYGGTNPDAWLLKTDANGNEKWNRTFGGGGTDIADSVQQTSDGGYIFAGYTDSPAESVDAWIVKTDANGNEKWEKTFDWKSADMAVSVHQTTDEGYILAGMAKPQGGSWIIKTDSNGNQLWNKTFKETGWAYSVQQTIDGGYIFLSSEELIKLGSESVERTPPKVTPLGIEKPAEKSTSGFEILGAMFSVVILFLINRTKA